MVVWREPQRHLADHPAAFHVSVAERGVELYAFTVRGNDIRRSGAIPNTLDPARFVGSPDTHLDREVRLLETLHAELGISLPVSPCPRAASLCSPPGPGPGRRARAKASPTWASYGVAPEATLPQSRDDGLGHPGEEAVVVFGIVTLPSRTPWLHRRCSPGQRVQKHNSAHLPRETISAYQRARAHLQILLRQRRNHIRRHWQQPGHASPHPNPSGHLRQRQLHAFWGAESTRPFRRAPSGVPPDWYAATRSTDRWPLQRSHAQPRPHGSAAVNGSGGRSVSRSSSTGPGQRDYSLAPFIPRVTSEDPHPASIAPAGRSQTTPAAGQPAPLAICPSASKPYLRKRSPSS